MKKLDLEDTGSPLVNSYHDVLCRTDDTCDRGLSKWPAEGK